MAQSRLERIGTIYSRVQSLIKGGAMKTDSEPMWCVIYRAFPPKTEPKFDRAVPNILIKPIYYEEDIIRAKFHEDHERSIVTDFSNDNRQSPTHKFIEIYQNLKKSGIPEAECYEKAVNEVKTSMSEHFDTAKKSSVQSPQPSPPLKNKENVMDNVTFSRDEVL